MRRLFLPLLAFGLTIAGCVRTVRIIYSAYTDPVLDIWRERLKTRFEFCIAIRDTSTGKMYYSFCTIAMHVTLAKERYLEHYRNKIETHVTNTYLSHTPLRLVLIKKNIVFEQFKDRVPYSEFTGCILSRYFPDQHIFSLTPRIIEYINPLLEKMHLDY